jgi:lysophospholipase L1-like esterase
LSIPDWGVTPFAAQKNGNKISEEISAFNKICESAALKNKTHFINITEETRKVKKDIGLLANDHLHYSAEAHAVWAKKTADLIKQIIRK